MTVIKCGHKYNAVTGFCCSDMDDFLTALALVLVIEGSAYALFPLAVKRMAAYASKMPDHFLRLSGLGAVVLGVVSVWVIRGW